MKVECSNQVMDLFMILVTGIGAYTDIKYHKIYNGLTNSAMLVGIGYHVWAGGLGGLLHSLSGILIGFSFAAFWILGMLKAGDIKLYMAVGALAGWRFCGYVMITSVLIGGAVAAFLMTIRKTGRTSLKRLKEYLLHLLYMKRFFMYQPEEKNAYFSFGCCIFAGALVTVWYLR